MIKPDFETFKQLAKEGNFIPIYTELLADMETPVTAYLKLKNKDFSFLQKAPKEESGGGDTAFLGLILS